MELSPFVFRLQNTPSPTQTAALPLKPPCTTTPLTLRVINPSLITSRQTHVPGAFRGKVPLFNDESARPCRERDPRLWRSLGRVIAATLGVALMPPPGSLDLCANALFEFE